MNYLLQIYMERTLLNSIGRYIHDQVISNLDTNSTCSSGICPCVTFYAFSIYRLLASGISNRRDVWDSYQTAIITSEYHHSKGEATCR